MSVCRSCGKAGLVWAKRPGATRTNVNRFHPPLERVELTSDVMVIEAGVVQRAPELFVKHSCHPEDIVAHEEHLRAREAELGEEGVRREEQRHLRQELDAYYIWLYSLCKDRVCPRCHTEPGEPCKNLTDRKLGRPERDTRMPHASRMPSGVMPPMSRMPVNLDN